MRAAELLGIDRRTLYRMLKRQASEEPERGVGARCASRWASRPLGLRVARRSPARARRLCAASSRRPSSCAPSGKAMPAARLRGRARVRSADEPLLDPDHPPFPRAGGPAGGVGQHADAEGTREGHRQGREPGDGSRGDRGRGHQSPAREVQGDRATRRRGLGRGLSVGTTAHRGERRGESAEERGGRLHDRGDHPHGRRLGQLRQQRRRGLRRETGELLGIVEGYRTAQMALPDRPERTLQLPVAGETLVIPARSILDFLAASGLGDLATR